MIGSGTRESKLSHSSGLSGASLVSQIVRNLPAMQETWVQSLGCKDPWRRKCQPTPVYLPGGSHGQSTLVGCSPQSQKSQTWLSEPCSLVRLRSQPQLTGSWAPGFLTWQQSFCLHPLWSSPLSKGVGQKSPLLSASLLTYIKFLPFLRVWSRDWSYLELLVSSTSESPFLFLREGELLPSSS